MNTLQNSTGFHGARRLTIVSLLMLGLFLMLQPASAKGKPAPGPVRCGTLNNPPCDIYLLSVDIEDQNGPGISSDGYGAYVDGSSEIDAKLPAGGMFIMNTGTYRWPVIDTTSPTGTFSPYEDPFPTGVNYRIFVASNTSSFQQMGTAGFPDTNICGYMGITFSDTSDAYRVSFSTSNSTFYTSPVSIERVADRDENGNITMLYDTWIIASDGCGSEPNVGELQVATFTSRGKPGRYVSQGTFNLPFRFTLTGTKQ